MKDGCRLKPKLQLLSIFGFQKSQQFLTSVAKHFNTLILL